MERADAAEPDAARLRKLQNWTSTVAAVRFKVSDFGFESLMTVQSQRRMKMERGRDSISGLRRVMRSSISGADEPAFESDPETEKNNELSPRDPA